jgi:hypothetical protein
MKYFFNIPAILFIMLLSVKANAQMKFSANAKVIQLPEDSLLKEFENKIYYTFYGQGYRKNNTTYTIMKVDINWDGKVTGINFSDSADSSFVNAWTNSKIGHDDKATLERYAQIKAYKSVSLLIPINYQYGYPVKQKDLSPGERDALMKFNNKNFSGKAIMFDPIKISVLGKGDM